MSINHEKWAQIFLKELVDHIQNYKGGDKYITYGELARRVDYPQPHTGNLFGRNIGYTLGEMGHMFDDILIDGEEIPLLQALVVSQNKKLPSDGLKEFDNSYPKLSDSKKRDFAQIEYDKIFNFGNKWLKVLKELKIPLNDKTINEIKQKRKFNQYGSEGSPEHIELRNFIAENPESIGLKSKTKGITEFPLKSGDKVDVVFIYSNTIIGVEVKSYRSAEDDIERGLFQCIKYQAVFDAENSVDGNNKESKCFLVIENSLSTKLKKIQKKLKIKVVEKFSKQNA
ncbi:MAG: hypothetical protein JXB44_00265 [Calditrichaceae bacterium]|nr:hypothetical protein [Calditrichaceae bacterium]